MRTVIKGLPALGASQALNVRLAPRAAVIPRAPLSLVARAAPGAAETSSSEAQQAQPARPRREKNFDASWEAAVRLQKSGEVREYTVRGYNKGGLTVKLGDIRGFVPYSYLDPSRFPAGKVPSYEIIETLFANVVGSKLSLRVMKVDVPARDLVLSERAVLIDQAVLSLQPDQVLDVVVKSIADFGAFVTVLGADGKTTGVDGLIKKGDLSWDRVTDVNNVVRIGDRFKVKVVEVDQARKRVSFSLKAMSRDPLEETLDTVLPVDDLALSSLGWREGSDPVEGLDFICKELLSETGIAGVTLGRQAVERRAVSQDLELWLTNQKVEDGYNLVARAGKIVQEVHVSTKLTREDMKGAIQRVLRRLP